MANIGYARVSADENDPTPQLAALAKANCLQVFQDHASGAKADRPGLTTALAGLRRGDVLVVTSLDRLGKSLSHLVALVDNLAARGVELRSLEDMIDTATREGAGALQIFTALARCDRRLILERTRAGLAAVTSRGRKPVITLEKLRKAKAMISEGFTVRETATRLGVGKTALYEAIRLDTVKRDTPRAVASSTRR